MKSLFGVFIMRRGGEDIWWRFSERIKSAKKERWRFGRWRFVFSCTVSQFELLHAMPNIIFLCFKILCIFLRVLKSGCMKGIPCQQRTVAWLYLLNTWRYFLEIREKKWDISWKNGKSWICLSASLGYLVQWKCIKVFMCCLKLFFMLGM